MKIKGKQDIEYWVTTSSKGNMIRVYRIDPLPDDRDKQNPFQVPILVDYLGKGEGIAEILDERDKLRKSQEYLEEQLLDARRKQSDVDRLQSKKSRLLRAWEALVK